jgi:signal transduction histidine kinase
LSKLSSSIVACPGVNKALITENLFQRDRRAPDYEAETNCLHALAHSLATGDGQVLQTLADAALLLCDAGSAGISLLENSEASAVFRWAATAGYVARFRNNTTPADDSPCGVTLELGGAQLFSYPQRHFDCLKGPVPEVVEGLVVPILGEVQPWGTIWVMSHDANALFDAEDARILTNLASFVGAALVIVTSKAAANARADEADAARLALEQAEIKKDDSIAMISHELRNPMAPILSAIQVAQHLSVGNGPVLAALRIAERQLNQLQRIVSDLLDASRIRYNKISVELSEVVLQEIIEDAIAAVKTDIEARGHTLRTLFPPSPVGLLADPVRITQVLTNVLSNAIKYTPDGGAIQVVVRSVTAANEPTGEPGVTIRITDNGVGISADALPSVFEMFSQASECVGRSDGGLGIGLAVVQHIVALHGGSVDVRSGGEGCGTEVVILLPTVPARPSKTV